MAAVVLHVGGSELPHLAPILYPALEPPGLLVDADVEPVLDEDDPVVDHGLLDRGDLLDEALALLRGAVPHARLDARTVVPTAVEDGDLTGGGELGDVALDVHLRLLALGRG